MDVAGTESGLGVVAELFANHALEPRRAIVPAGTTLFEPDSAAEKVYFIIRGQVRTYQVGANGDGRLLEILGDNEWFGSAAFATAQTYGARAVAFVPTTLIEVSAEKLREVLREHPRAAVELLRQVAVRLQNAREDAGLLVFDDCHHRLIKTLVKFSTSAAATQQNDTVVLRITHHQLAQAVGVARETVSLALTQLRNQNVLRTGRNQLIFRPDDLRRLKSGNGNGNGSVNGHGHADVGVERSVEPVRQFA